MHWWVTGGKLLPSTPSPPLLFPACVCITSFNIIVSSCCYSLSGCLWSCIAVTLHAHYLHLIHWRFTANLIAGASFLKLLSHLQQQQCAWQSCKSKIHCLFLLILLIIRPVDMNWTWRVDHTWVTGQKLSLHWTNVDFSMWLIWIWRIEKNFPFFFFFNIFWSCSLFIIVTRSAIQG